MWWGGGRWARRPTAVLASLASTCYQRRMTVTQRLEDDPDQFGTLPFYAAIGRAFVTMCGIVVVLAAIELVNYLTPNHDQLDRAAGIVPRSVSHLDGILFAPFLHVSWLHLYGNAIALLLTGTFVMASGVRRFLWVTAFIALVSGLGAWLITDSGYVVGASGVIFGWVAFLLVRGVVERTWWTIVVALLIGGLYGWQIYSAVVPSDPNISWQGHLFGLIGGVVAAVLFRRRRSKPTPSAPSITSDLPTTLNLPTV